MTLKEIIIMGSLLVASFTIIYITGIHGMIKLYKEQKGKENEKNNRKFLIMTLVMTIVFAIIFFLSSCSASAKETGFLDYIDNHPELTCGTIAGSSAVGFGKGSASWAVANGAATNQGTLIAASAAIAVGTLFVGATSYDLCIRHRNRRVKESAKR